MQANADDADEDAAYPDDVRSKRQEAYNILGELSRFSMPSAESWKDLYNYNGIMDRGSTERQQLHFAAVKAWEAFFNRVWAALSVRNCTLPYALYVFGIMPQSVVERNNMSLEELRNL